MNKERLIELRDFFAGVPKEKVRMWSWAIDYDPDGNNENYSCLTAGCLAGWAGVYKPFIKQGYRIKYVESDGRIIPSYDGAYHTKAFAKFFDLDFARAACLVDPEAYPNDGRVTKEQVLERLDAMIAGTFVLTDDLKFRYDRI